jgi:hypothetical protein
MPYEGKAGTPGIVTAGFILAFLCFPIGFVLCLVGLGEAQRRGEGVGLAQTGIVISIVFATIAVIWFVLRGT